eukprot:752000-Hanusia_phi.AAC.1
MRMGEAGEGRRGVDKGGKIAGAREDAGPFGYNGGRSLSHLFLPFSLTLYPPPPPPPPPPLLFLSPCPSSSSCPSRQPHRRSVFPPSASCSRA